MDDNGKIDIIDQMKDNFNKSISSLKPSDSVSPATTSASTNKMGETKENYFIDLINQTEDSNFKASNGAQQETANIEVAQKNEDLEVISPTKRLRLRSNSKSIIQSAIARKEESFSTYERPKRKRTQKRRTSTADKKIEVQESPPKKPVLPRKTKSSPRAFNKSIYVEQESSEDSLENENNLKKISSPLFSDKKSKTVSKNNETLTKAQIASRLCKCTENKQLYKESDADTQFCTAVDSLSDKIVGCSRLVDIRKVPMYRPSTRVPFGVYCESHKQRLIRHNCCPTCGVFCTEGNFSECPSKHHFHNDCRLSIENKDYCPHCGDSAPSTNIRISMHSSKDPVFFPVQRSQHTSARMTFKDNKEDSNNSIETSKNLLVPIISLKEIEHLKSRLNGKNVDYNETDIIEAIENNDLERVAIILGNGNLNIKLKIPDYNNGNLLHLAALKGKVQIAYFLLLNHIDIDVLDSEQNSALMLAINEHKNDWVRYLIHAGADITLKGIDGMTCLHMAAKAGNFEACKIILDSSYPIQNFVNFQDDGGWTPLVWACEHGFCDIVKYLISKGADINTRDVQHNVALHWAAFKGNSQVIEVLLNLKLDINVQNIHGDTPLHISAREDHYNCVIILLSRKANISIINKNNETPLDCSVKDGLCFTPLALNIELNFIDKLNEGGLLANDISRGRELNPIQCFNNVDNEKEPKQYTYIKRNCQNSDNFHVDTKVTTLKSCSCIDKCISTECSCTKLSVKCWYDDKGKLLPDFNLFDTPLIFECNDFCTCNSILCVNRLVQKPLTERFELFKTSTKGWGIKSLNFIAKGNYVCEYIGEILTDLEAEQREDDTYLFDLDNKETDSFCIDAKYYGNFARFINHSCEPNLHPIKVFVEHHDLRFPRIAFFAKKNIKANEELSFDYGEKFWLVKYKSFTCECGTSSCKYSKDTIRKTLEKYQRTEKPF